MATYKKNHPCNNHDDYIKTPSIVKFSSTTFIDRVTSKQIQFLADCRYNIKRKRKMIELLILSQTLSKY
jgi:hypothetical protein